MDNHIGMIT